MIKTMFYLEGTTFSRILHPAIRRTVMPYSAGHREHVKKRIVQSARQLFNRRGFENVSLSQIMAGAGLTHGGFYSYFKSKSDLCRGVGLLPDRSGMEELLGGSARRSVVHRRRPASGSCLLVSPAF